MKTPWYHEHISWEKKESAINTHSRENKIIFFLYASQVWETIRIIHNYLQTELNWYAFIANLVLDKVVILIEYKSKNKISKLIK